MPTIEKIINEHKVIGFNKYKQLKSFNFKTMTAEKMVNVRKEIGMSVAEAEDKIEKYENKHNFLNKPTEYAEQYFKKLRNPQEPEVKWMTKGWLYGNFLKTYRQNEGVEYSKDQERIDNIEPLIHYFLGDIENFKNCKNVSKISRPSIDKGLLIIGGYGTGKTSSMNAFEMVLKRTNIAFKGYTTNGVVKMYETSQNPSQKAEFDNKIFKGIRYFDDLLTERLASNYGKSNLFKDILEERCSKGLRIYGTCNYKDGSNDDLKQGLNQFGEKYGSRVYDRLFQMFNIVEFKGKSFRK